MAFIYFKEEVHYDEKILTCLLCAALCLSMAACQSNSETPAQEETAKVEQKEEAQEAPEATEQAEESSSSETSTQYPLTISTYNYAKEPVEYTFEKAPERVWAQNQNNIETMLALGLADKIVGACGLDGEIREDLKEEFAKINYYESMPSKEEILALEPDFITGWYSTFSDKRLGDVNFWHERKVGTYMSLNSACRGPAAENPQTINEECEDILTLGKIFDVEDRAKEIVDEIQSEVEKINKHLESQPRLTAAVLEDEGGSYRVYGEDTLGGNVAVNGGAELAVGKHGENGNISAEDLIAVNPDAIFMVWYDGYSVGDVDYAGEHVVKLITEDPKFASLDAVKNGRVYPINLSGIYCSGMRTLDGILDVSKNLYPELYQD